MSVRPLVLFEDEPVPNHTVDELGLKEFSEVVAGAAVGTHGPFTVGVFGDWGSGKTSVLNQAQSLIESDSAYENVVTVRFNAWKFDKDPEPIVSLLATIVTTIEKRQEHLKGSAADRLREGFVRVANCLRGIAYGLTIKASLFKLFDVEGDVKEMIDREEYLNKAKTVVMVRSLYYDAFDSLSAIAASLQGAGSAMPQVVIFVDDLDRCFPDNALRLLESIKLFLGEPGFVFVLAVSPAVIEAYLEKRYRDEFNVQDYGYGTHYLDKIVQLPLYLPSHESRFPRYVENLLQRPTIRNGDGLAERFTELTQVLLIGSTYNPRNLIRYINNLLVDIHLLRVKNIDEKELLPFCAISRFLQQHLDHRFYRQLADDKDLCESIASPDNSNKAIDQRNVAVGDANRNERRRHLLDELARREIVINVLDSETGRRWLKEHKKRRIVDEFLKTERPDQEVSTKVSINVDRLNQLIDKKKKTVKDIAVEIGRSTGALQREINARLTDERTLDLIARVLGVPPIELRAAAP